MFIKSAEMYEIFRTTCNTHEVSRFRSIANDTQQCLVGSGDLLEIEGAGFICTVCKKEISDGEVVEHLISAEHFMYFVVSIPFVRSTDSK